MRGEEYERLVRLAIEGDDTAKIELRRANLRRHIFRVHELLATIRLGSHQEGYRAAGKLYQTVIDRKRTWIVWRGAHKLHVSQLCNRIGTWFPVEQTKGQVMQHLLSGDLCQFCRSALETWGD